jgi:hypothetical protein
MATVSHIHEDIFNKLPLALQLQTMMELGSIKDIHTFTKASTTASDILQSHFNQVVSLVLKRTVHSDFRQLIWAILDAKRQREHQKLPGPSLAEFLTKLGDAEYPLWPDWAPKNRYTLMEIAALIDNAGFFNNIQKLCRDTFWHWPDHRATWDQITRTPRPVDLPYYIFELYCALFHVEDGADDMSTHAARLRANDHDTFVCFFAQKAPQNKLHTGSCKASEHSFYYVFWVFGFLYKLIEYWMGHAIQRVQTFASTPATIAYQLSRGMPHIRKMMRLGVRAESVVHWNTDGGFLPGFVTQCIEMGFNLGLAPEGYVWTRNHDPRMTIRSDQRVLSEEDMGGIAVFP